MVKVYSVVMSVIQAGFHSRKFGEPKVVLGRVHGIVNLRDRRLLLHRVSKSIHERFLSDKS